MSLIDSKQRQQALDIKQSFIVQAPAGSGKTELLTKRFLTLLANVRQAPEEIVAITFTRKAATEMRTRILESLKLAEKKMPDTVHEMQTWHLAKKVLERNQDSNWNLLQNPNRLRILTIDALCARLIKSAPALSYFGTPPKIIEDATPFYYQAAQLLLAQLEEENVAYVFYLEKLLLHLDNNFSLAEDLFVGMLNRRDQWLGHIINYKNNTSPRDILECGLQNVIIDSLEYTSQFFDNKLKEEFFPLILFAAHNLGKLGIKDEITECIHLERFPEVSAQQIKVWKGIAHLLLNQSFDWRKSINKNLGFPAASEAIDKAEELLFKDMKNRMLNFLAKLNKDENEALRFSLKEIILLPPGNYSEQQWEMVNALISLLPVLVAHLHLIFREENKADFIAIAEGALHALGESDNPSDLALNLDYKIQHLLIDEFQDTSLTQFLLLKLLTAGWERDEGRTLFLVGDPMQSIYRFREADVGLFLEVKKHGINNIKLKPLTLKVNFRSKAPLVNWFNQIFKDIFPQNENADFGAIPFCPSVSFSDNTERKVTHDGDKHVNIHSLHEDNNETNYIINLVRNEINHDPEKSIAILVRSRSHLQSIIPSLKKANIAFEAIEIEQLICSPVVRDLCALTRAIMHIGDKIAWLSVLRAPWCGLSLQDLYSISHFKPHTTLWQKINKFNLIPNLSEEALSRLNRVVPILNYAIQNRARKNLRQEIAYIWYALGGPACLNEEYEINNASAYFQLLENFCNDFPFDFHQLEKKLSTTYSHNMTVNAKVYLMTIHRAKGLEFDVVILPCLEKKPRRDGNPLLIWLERQNNQGNNDLILAPIKSLSEEFDPIYRYISTKHTIKHELEIARLLYVASTRSREKIHLIGKLAIDKKDNKAIKPPINGCFLHLFWPALQNEFQLAIQKENTENLPDRQDHLLTKLAKNWESPSFLPAFDSSSNKGNSLFRWSSHYLDYVGKVIHECLDKISQIENVNSFSIGDEKLIWKKKLFQLGVTRALTQDCLLLIEKAIQKTLRDPRGLWILSKHLNAKSEFSLTAVVESEVVHYIIDRTFIDHKGVRWIIDYKTTDLSEKDEINLLTKAKLRYSNQLENYAKAFRQSEDREIKLGVYFPLFSGWCEWDFIN